MKKLDVLRVEPPNWWVGFKETSLQLLVHYQDISERKLDVFYPGVTIKNIHYADSPNYLFIDLHISKSTKAGHFNLVFKKEHTPDLVFNYTLKSRITHSKDYIGFNSTDAIYLITPDRFSNGNPSIDINEALNEKNVDRNDNYARHGGDIKGIINQLDYINNLGFTAIWLTPLLTNNMYHGSYHGYAITDFYQIDPRFGTLNDYLMLSIETTKRGMKLIMDQVANHCGLEHWWLKDFPFKNWINHQDNYVRNRTNWNETKSITTTHRRTTNQDDYASNFDKKGMSEGWFVSVMPDLNHRNPFMAKYTIQNSIWWIETANLRGIRQDTYSYPDKGFMSLWAGAIMNEYPNFSIVGEEWTNNPLLIAYWQHGNPNKDGYLSNLKSPMDFAMQETVVNSLNNQEGYDSGLIELYEALANDFAYTKPSDIMVFPDNHDMSRIFTRLNGDIAFTKMAVSFLALIPRVLQIFYGTEILMQDFENPGDHGLVRSDFPGGWKGDQVNAFTGKGLNENQVNMQGFVKKLLNFRKHSKAIHYGKTVHFVPENGVYVLFRILDNETVIHIMNKNQGETKLYLAKFNEIGLQGRAVKNIITSYTFFWGDNITLQEKGCFIFSTKL
ncbi:glycoside hydrolase family 13 protein [Algibacter pectinivorans]|uniref:Glycosidase n=1 Tax=Algibacter pectinivorans TaxID=870482 RepID=A0A1I1MIJ3_9FLAO|nr:glycoside hydrolase family 13 protein [Algibacter pectinivorans]SFC84662.1 Glycosidase [Algibacter pectinivorans]